MSEQGSEHQSRGKLRLYDAYELAALRPKEWLIDGMLMAGGFISMVGKPETFKSFALVDMAWSMATGRDWFGRPVKHGNVLYIAAEGGYTIGERHDAWRAARGRDDTQRCKFSDDPIDLRDEYNVERVIEACLSLPERPVMVGVDTMSRTFGGADENTSEGMGPFIHGCDRIRAETGAAVVVIHHEGWQNERSRGHSSFPAAIDTEIHVSREKSNDTIVLKCSKMRMAKPFEPITLKPREIDLGHGRSSLVLELVDDGRSKSASAANMLDAKRQRAIAFAMLAHQMGNPFVVDIADYQGLDPDTVGRYAKRVESDYGFVEVRKERDGRSFKNRVLAYPERINEG